MNNAFDAVLQLNVSANTAAKSRGFEPYRYKCLCCGEDVYIAAPFSKKKAPHFRHKRGNNETECEQYMNQVESWFGFSNDLFGIGKDSYSHRNKHKQVDFFYDNIKERFEIGIVLSKAEIEKYEQAETSLQLGDKRIRGRFGSIKVNRRNFVADEQFVFPLNEFSQYYCISFSSENTSTECKQLFRSDGNPSFFKIFGSDDEFRAKLIQGGIIFTDTMYFVVFQDNKEINRIKKFNKDIEIVKENIVKTMKRTFYCLVLKVAKKSRELDEMLSAYGFQIESAEEAKLLWPPAALCDDKYEVLTDNVVLYSSFKLYAHGNTNVESNDILEIGKGVSILNIYKKTKIHCKNTEIIFAPIVLTSCESSTLEIEVTYIDKFNVPSGDNEYYLYDEDGTTLLQAGQNVYLTPNSKIIQYRQGYITGYILYQNKEFLYGEQLLKDILCHYHRTEIYVEDDFNTCELSEIATRYIQECKMKGTINVVAKEYIKGGKI